MSDSVYNEYAINDAFYLKKLFFMTQNIYKDDLPEDLELTGPIAIDTETLGLNPLRDRLCLVQLSSGDGVAHLVQFSQNNYGAPRLKALLTNKDQIKIFHFARFDIAVIQHYLGVMTQSVYCTKIASKLTRTYTDRHGLKDLCKELLQVELSKQQQSSDWGAVELSQEQCKYAASDVLYLHKIKEKLDDLLTREQRMGIAKECFSFLPTRALLDLKGWHDMDIFAH